MVSAENVLGMASQPLTTAPPAFQIERIRFSRMLVFLFCCEACLRDAAAGRVVAYAVPQQICDVL
jgi:hypothetical protein